MQKIRNIIFDLGGVLFDINYSFTQKAFQDAGILHFNEIYSQLKQNHLFDDFETGKISSDEFCKVLSEAGKNELSPQQIADAWNAMLIGLPQHKISLLKKLKQQYRLFLLSNTNEIHETAFKKMITDNFGRNVLEEIFEGIYLSHRIHERKPNAAAFNKVLIDEKILAEETVFIDDTLHHVEGAKQCGINAFYLPPETDLEKLLIENGLMLQ